MGRMGSWPCLGAPLLGPSPGSQQCMRQDVEVSMKNQDAQTRQLQDAVTNAEKHLGELCLIFAV